MVIVVTPTISLIQDQVTNLEEKGMKAVRQAQPSQMSVSKIVLSQLGVMLAWFLSLHNGYQNLRNITQLHELVSNSKITTTIFYNMSHTERVIFATYHNCSQILKEFSNSWTDVMANLPCKCWRQVLLKFLVKQCLRKVMSYSRTAWKFIGTF